MSCEILRRAQNDKSVQTAQARLFCRTLFVCELILVFSGTLQAVMYMQSIWSANTELPRFPALAQNKKTDVLVVGGGIAGLLCAYRLKTYGVNCILLEADRICRGVTQNTTAKITVQHGFLYDKLIKRFGKEKAQMYLRANERALQNYRVLAKKFPCDFENKENVVYTVDDYAAAERELHALEALGVRPSFEKELPVPLRIAGAVRVPNQAQFHPLKFLSQIAKALEIYEQTKVFEIRGNCAYTAHGTVAAEQFVIATHFPILNKHGAYYLKLYQERSYVLALENGPQINGMYVDEAQKGMSFRNAGDFLLVGGGDHCAGRQFCGTAAICKNALPRVRHALRVGNAGLYELGQCAVYRAVRKNAPECVCCDRISQMGHDLVYGGGRNLVRRCFGKGKRLCARFFAVAQYPFRTASEKRRHVFNELADADAKTLSAYGLCFKMECGGAHVGLPLPRFPISRGRQAD